MRVDGTICRQLDRVSGNAARVSTCPRIDLDTWEQTYGAVGRAEVDDERIIAALEWALEEVRV